ncbi:MAG: SO_0444 family Cu/Zn efflux transporter [Bacteroidales bacterium]|nr:SO_0444 family Cu/Zn efflux transporter [Bacteroidales bacterium]
MDEILLLINEMSPYLLLGFLLAGLMHAFIPGRYYTRYLSKPTLGSVINAAIFGIPLPLCSCGVIPTAMSLRKEGASRGAVTSFLIATPQTGIDSIIATFSLMGVPFAVIRPIAALITAVLGGWMVNTFVSLRDRRAHREMAEGTIVKTEETETCTCHCHCHENKAESCCPEGDSDDHHHHHHHSGEHHHHSSHHRHSSHHHHSSSASCHCHDRKIPNTIGGKIVEALRYAFLDMMSDIGKWLVIGLVVAGLITIYVPDEVFTIFKDNTMASMILVLIISIPMYLCATGSIPIAVVLMLKGLTPGAALVLLMAGPACNMASILVIRKGLGFRTLVIYILSIIIGAVFFGCLIDWLQYSGMIDFTSRVSQTMEIKEGGAGIIKWTSTIVLTLLLLFNLIFKPLGKPKFPG